MALHGGRQFAGKLDTVPRQRGSTRCAGLVSRTPSPAQALARRKGDRAAEHPGLITGAPKLPRAGTPKGSSWRVRLGPKHPHISHLEPPATCPGKSLPRLFPDAVLEGEGKAGRAWLRQSRPADYAAEASQAAHGSKSPRRSPGPLLGPLREEGRRRQGHGEPALPPRPGSAHVSHTWHAA